MSSPEPLDSQAEWPAPAPPDVEEDHVLIRSFGAKFATMVVVVASLVVAHALGLRVPSLALVPLSIGVVLMLVLRAVGLWR